MFCWIITTFLQATITVLGGFLPIFCLMFIHYKVRKSFYNKNLQIYGQFLDFSKLQKKQIEQQLDKIYQQYSAKDMSTLLSKLATNQPPSKEAMDTAMRLEKEKSDFELEVIKDENKLQNLKTYKFRDYIVNILNKNYPDTF